MTYEKIIDLLGKQDGYLLSHKCETVGKEKLYLPGNDFIDRVCMSSNRNIQTLCSLNSIFKSGRLTGTGYVSILPVDQGVEHTAGASFSANPMYFDPENIIKLAIEGGCNAVASTFGGLAIIARKYAHKIPFIVKLNHNELLTYPNKFNQIMFGTVRDAWNLGAVAVGATVYFGSAESDGQIISVARAFEEAHSLGMATILWCYLRNNYFKTSDIDYHVSADLTGQANYLGVTIQADIIKQKIPENNGAYKALNTDGKSYGKFDNRMYTKISSDNPIDLCRYQVINCFMGRSGLINSGGASYGEADLRDLMRTAIINKRAGGMGIIAGRKAFQKTFKEGTDLLHAIQDVYLNKLIDVA